MWLRMIVTISVSRRFSHVFSSMGLMSGIVMMMLIICSIVMVPRSSVLIVTMRMWRRPFTVVPRRI